MGTSHFCKCTMCILTCRLTNAVELETIFIFTFIIFKQLKHLTEQRKLNFIEIIKQGSEENKLIFEQTELSSSLTSLTSYYTLIHSFFVTYHYNYKNNMNCSNWTTKNLSHKLSTKIFFGYYDR